VWALVIWGGGFGAWGADLVQTLRTRFIPENAWQDFVVVQDDAGQAGTGASNSSAQTTTQTGGDEPDGYRIVHHSTGLGDFLVSGAVSATARYSPHASGALVSLNLSIEASAPAGGSGLIYAVVEQDGTRFFSPPLLNDFSGSIGGEWRLNGLRAEHFGRDPALDPLRGAGSHPDFSIRGAPMLFGYAVASTNNAPTVTNTAYRLANLEFTLFHQEPPPPPLITVAPKDQSVALGGRIDLVVVVSSPASVRYQWRRNGTDLAGATNAQLTILNAQFGDGGSYTVVATSEFGTTESNPAAITIQAPVLPLSDEFAGRGTVSGLSGFGQGTNLGASPEAGEPLHARKRGGHSVWLTWRAPGSGIVRFSTSGSGFDTLLAVYTGASLNALRETASDEDSGGFLTSQVSFNATAGVDYQIAVDGFFGATGNILLHWETEVTAQTAPQITRQPVSVAVAAGSPAEFEVEATGSGLSFEWRLNGTPLPGARTARLTLSNVGPDQVGFYTVLVSNGSRAVISEAASLQIVGGDAAGEPVKPQAGDKLGDVFLAARLAVAPAFVRASAGLKPSAPTLVRGFSASQLFSTLESARELGEPNHCGVIGGASQWLAYLAPTSGLLSIQTDGSDFRTVLAVYTSADGSLENLKLVACDGSGGENGRNSQVVMNAERGEIYFVAVDGVDGASGRAKVSLEMTVPLRLLSPQLSPLGVLSFTVQAAAGTSFEIQASSNLVEWSKVADASAPNGTYLFSGQDFLGPRQRFYRAARGGGLAGGSGSSTQPDTREDAWTPEDEHPPGKVQMGVGKRFSLQNVEPNSGPSIVIMSPEAGVTLFGSELQLNASASYSNGLAAVRFILEGTGSLVGVRSGTTVYLPNGILAETQWTFSGNLLKVPPVSGPYQFGAEAVGQDLIGGTSQRLALSTAHEALSREVSVFNFGSPPPREAISREVTVFGEHVPPDPEAISREISIFNLAERERPEAISREVSLVNEAPAQ
jgi:hypothetical protein